MIKFLVPLGIAGAGLFFAAPAAAAPDDIVNIGNDTLGYSQGTTGASVAIGGVRTTVDGFGTLQGSTVVTAGDYEIFSIRQSYQDEFESTTSFANGTYSHTTEVYYPPNTWVEWEYKTPNGSFALVCAPLTGCQAGS